ncbi:MAG: VOC family protein [Bacteroidota bacterium]
MFKKGCLIALGLLVGLFTVSYGLIQRRLTQLKPSPTIEETPTTIIGFNHIGLVVKDLDQMLDFYQRATNFELVSREKVSNNEAANRLFGQDTVSYEVATLKCPNFLLELTQFDHQTDTIIEKMPPYGPGMTHTCFQTSEKNSGYRKFVDVGVDMITRGNEPIDLGGYGVTYAYAHDPEGNMVELEQMSDFVIWLKIDEDFSEKHKMWMTQVAIMTPNIKELAAFYEDVYEVAPYRWSDIEPMEVMAKVIDLEGVSLKGAWFMLDGKEKKMELFQYGGTHPTPNTTYKRSPTELGYTFSIEVLDIQKEYERLKAKGVEFLSEPQEVGKFRTVFARDTDGNIFSLRQALDPAFSAPNI